MGLGGRGKVTPLSIIAPSGRPVGFEESRRRVYAPRATSHLLSAFYLLDSHLLQPRTRPRVYRTRAHRRRRRRGWRGPAGERCSTVFDIREELLDDDGTVVVASSREKRAPGPDLSSVPMRVSARYRPRGTTDPPPSGVMSRISRL